jgi:hypothetical protein
VECEIESETCDLQIGNRDPAIVGQQMRMVKLLMCWREDGVVTEAFRPSGSLLANVNLVGQAANAQGDDVPGSFQPCLCHDLAPGNGTTFPQLVCCGKLRKQMIDAAIGGSYPGNRVTEIPLWRYIRCSVCTSQVCFSTTAFLGGLLSIEQ